MYTDSFYPYVSGVSTAVLTLSQALAEAGHEVFIQAPRPKQEVDLSFLHKNVTVHYVRAIDVYVYPDFRIGTGLPLSLQHIRAFDPDVIHVHTPLSIGLEGILIGRALKKPLVHTYHTYFLHEDWIRILGVNNTRLAQIISKGGHKFNQVFCHWFDAITAPTKQVAGDLKKMGIRKPVKVCPNLVEDELFARRSNTRHKLQRLLYAGRLSTEKRVDLVLKAFQLLHAKHPHLELVCIGDGPSRDELFQLSLDLGIGPYVRWYGQIPHDQLLAQRLYHHGDVFFSLSRSETYGYTTIEAMAHGLPVVVIANKVSKELTNGTGFLVSDSSDPKVVVREAVKALDHLTSLDLADYQRAAYQQAKNFQTRNILPLYTEVYESVIAAKAP